MSGFGSPNSDTTHAQYRADFTHTNGQILSVVSELSPGSGVLDPTDMDAAWAAAIALLDGDANFTFSGGSKTYTTGENYTL